MKFPIGIVCKTVLRKAIYTHIHATSVCIRLLAHLQSKITAVFFYIILLNWENWNKTVCEPRESAYIQGYYHIFIGECPWILCTFSRLTKVFPVIPVEWETVNVFGNLNFAMNGWLRYSYMMSVGNGNCYNFTFYVWKFSF